MSKRASKRRTPDPQRADLTDRRAPQSVEGFTPIASLSRPWVAFVLALTVYCLVTAFKGDFAASSRWNYYAHLADALLHGQLHLRILPPTTHDLSEFGGKYYLYWPPFPAVLMAPFVYLFGVSASDFLFNNVVGALNVGLVAAVLRCACNRGVVDCDDRRVGLLVLFFAFGTMHFVLAVGGTVWYTGQLVAFGCGAIAYLIAIAMSGLGAFLLAGVVMGAVLTTRSPMILCGVWPAFELLRRHWCRGAPFRCVAICLGLLPVAVFATAYAIYNRERFGSAFDVGYDYHLMHEHFREGFRTFGALSVHFAPKNLYYHFLAYPLPLRAESLEGGSLFLMSPVFVAAFWAFRSPSPSKWVLLATCVVTYIPIMLLLGTGWAQWGPRYLLDLTIPLMLLVAAGIKSWPLPVAMVLAAVSIVHYVIGVAWRP